MRQASSGMQFVQRAVQQAITAYICYFIFCRCQQRVASVSYQLRPECDSSPAGRLDQTFALDIQTSNDPTMCVDHTQNLSADTIPGKQEMEQERQRELAKLYIADNRLASTYVRGQGGFLLPRQGWDLVHRRLCMPGARAASVVRRGILIAFGRTGLPRLRQALLHIPDQAQHFLIQQQPAPACARTCLSGCFPWCTQNSTVHPGSPEQARWTGKLQGGPHVGQVACSWSQLVTQPLWKMWPQGSETTLLSASSSWQMLHSTSSTCCPSMHAMVRRPGGAMHACVGAAPCAPCMHAAGQRYASHSTSSALANLRALPSVT